MYLFSSRYNDSVVTNQETLEICSDKGSNWAKPQEVVAIEPFSPQIRANTYM
jgi:hypothetical protein